MKTIRVSRTPYKPLPPQHFGSIPTCYILCVTPMAIYEEVHFYQFFSIYAESIASDILQRDVMMLRKHIKIFYAASRFHYKSHFSTTSLLFEYETSL